MNAQLRGTRWAISVRWPLAVTFGLAAALVLAPLFWLVSDAADESERDARRAQLALAQMAAGHADHILVEAFFELELAAAALGTSTAGGRRFIDPTIFVTPVLLLDGTSADISTTLSGEALPSDDLISAALLGAASASDRWLSEPFLSARTGHPTSIISLPIYDDEGGRPGTIVGFLDLDRHVGDGLKAVAARLGTAGHVDFIGPDGAVFASTEHAEASLSGRHPNFYEAASLAAEPIVEEAETDMDPPQERGAHLMAYAPMRSAPWGVALGTRTDEAYQSADDLRRRGMRVAAASVAVCLLGLVLVSTDVRRADDTVGAA